IGTRPRRRCRSSSELVLVGEWNRKRGCRAACCCYSWAEFLISRKEVFLISRSIDFAVAVIARRVIGGAIGRRLAGLAARLARGLEVEVAAALQPGVGHERRLLAGA